MRIAPAVFSLAIAAAAFAGDPATTSAAPPPPGLVYVGLNDRGAEEWLRAKDGATVIRVPRGTYLKRPYEPMATTAEPQAVDVESFYVDKFEVTNARFARFLTATGGDLSALWREGLPGIVRDGGGFAAAPGLDEFPVTAATGIGATAYAAWAGGRIPSQAEWEKAAGGPDGRIWPWGDAPPDAARANFGRPSPRGPERVGSHAAGASYYGCMDMAGNVYDRVVVRRGQRFAPEMIKGGSWASPHPLNLRVLDLCMQPDTVADRTVGFRCAMDDAEPGRPTRTAAAPPALRLATDFDAAVEEARRRRVPIFLSLLFDTCGQCDRTRIQLFRDARFVAYCNENMVVVVGQEPGDAMDEPHPPGPGGACPLLPGLTCDQHVELYTRGVAVVGSFVVSPGNFVLDPDRTSPGAGAAAVLVKELDLPKWGDAVDAYLAQFEKARAAMAAGPAETVVGRLAASVWVCEGAKNIVGAGADEQIAFAAAESGGVVAELRTIRYFSVNDGREPEAVTRTVAVSVEAPVLVIDGRRRTFAFDGADLVLGAVVAESALRWVFVDDDEEWRFDFAADPRTGESGGATVRGSRIDAADGVTAVFAAKDRGESIEVALSVPAGSETAWNLPRIEFRKGESVGWLVSGSARHGQRFRPRAREAPK